MVKKAAAVGSLAIIFILSACSSKTSEKADTKTVNARYLPPSNIRELLERDPERASMRTGIVNSCAKQMRSTISAASEAVSDTTVANTCECGADAAMAGKSNEQIQQGETNPTKGMCTDWIKAQE